MTTQSTTYNFVVSVTPKNGTTRAAAKARLEKRLGGHVKHLGHVLQAAKATEARMAQRNARRGA
jgi:hypothetical protein